SASGRSGAFGTRCGHGSEIRHHTSHSCSWQFLPLSCADVAEVEVGEASVIVLQSSLGEPLPALLVFILRLDVVLEVRVAALGVTPPDGAEVDTKGRP